MQAMVEAVPITAQLPAVVASRLSATAQARAREALERRNDDVGARRVHEPEPGRGSHVGQGDDASFDRRQCAIEQRLAVLCRSGRGDGQGERDDTGGHA